MEVVIVHLAYHFQAAIVLRKWNSVLNVSSPHRTVWRREYQFVNLHVGKTLKSYFLRYSVGVRISTCRYVLIRSNLNQNGQQFLH